MSVAISLVVGDGVEVEELRGSPVRGVFLFAEDGWLYWREQSGWVHASRPDGVRVVRVEVPSTLRGTRDDMRHDAKPNTHGSVRAHGSSEVVSNNG